MGERDINFENKLWKAADKMRKKVEVHEYKYIVLGLIFLRYISFAFEEKQKEIINKTDKKILERFGNDLLEDRDVYLSDGILYVPEKARWDYIKENANQSNIGEILDNTIDILEKEYPKQLKNVIPKIYTKINLEPDDLAYLINVFSTIDFGNGHKGKDIFGRIYEYFLGKFTEAEGKKGGEFYTPRSLTQLIVEILDVKEGRIFDPSCGSGGFFVSALEKLEREGKEKALLSIYGQESKEFVWKIAKMNLAIRGAEGDIRIGDSYHDDKFPDLRADYVVSNPPFNDSGWGADRVKENDPKFKYGIPPDNNGNYAWIQHYIYHLAPNGKAGFVMANGALSGGGIEGEIRKKIIEDDLIYGIIAAPAKLFYTVSLPVSLWFLRKEKPEHMKEKVLFINAKKMFKPLSRRQVIFTDEHISKMVEKFKMFEAGEDEEKINEVGFAKVATIEDIKKNGYVLTPGRYVGVKIEDDGIPFEKKMEEYSKELSKLLEEEKELTEKVKEVFNALEFNMGRGGGKNA
ncbi:type I restriction-modification system subunit M [Methanothermococcus sp. SCGC AD-155-C09]|nr:type I restriction-modification system subunit M [Methanothermococcus sp. SCGC AD-155-C09]